MKTKIYEDDEYPFYRIDDKWGSEVDVPEEKLKRWRKVMEDFREVQQEIEEYYKNKSEQ